LRQVNREGITTDYYAHRMFPAVASRQI